MLHIEKELSAMINRIIAWIVFAAQTVLIWIGLPVNHWGQKLDLEARCLQMAQRYPMPPLNMSGYLA